MLIFLISCISFIFVLKSISFKPLLPGLYELKAFSPFFLRELSDCLISSMTKMRLLFYGTLEVPVTLTPVAAKPSVYKMLEGVELEADDEMSLLDLPELALENILERLSPAELCSMAGVCSYLRDRCRSDHLWERHRKRKWGRVIGDTAYRKWKCHVAISKRSLIWRRLEALFGYMLNIWPSAVVRSKPENRSKQDSSFPIDDSIMAQYLSLESGKFWFPAQVYNRENGDGFLLSCYDADLSYNSTTDSFRARYSTRERHTIEENVTWDRLRAPPVATAPYVLHISDCLDDLKPEDHIEIQWRRSNGYPYGWWYGAVGHLDSCIRTEGWCQCHESDKVVLEFNQYPVDSHWRTTMVNRKNHPERGNEADGFYGGIRKLYDQKEISKWKSIWPKNILDQ